MIPDRKTQGGTRFCNVAKLQSLGDADAPTIGYARVSSHDQKAYLERQKEMLETYCAAKGWRTEVIADLGSGMNFNKRGLRRLIGKFYASILVDTQDCNPHAPKDEAVGVDFGVKSLAVLSDGTVFPANQKLKANLKRLKQRQRRLSRKVKGSRRRTQAKTSLAKLHARIAHQRRAVLHDVSDHLTRNYKTICIEDLNVRGMTQNHRLTRAVTDAGFGMLRQFIEYKAALRGGTVAVIGRFAPSSKMCSVCGQLHDIPLSNRQMVCDCGNEMDRDLNAAKNILKFDLDTLTPDLKRAQESCKTSVRGGADVDGAKMTTPADFHR